MVGHSYRSGVELLLIYLRMYDWLTSTQNILRQPPPYREVHIPVLYESIWSMLLSLFALHVLRYFTVNNTVYLIVCGWWINMITMKWNDDKFGLHVSCNHVFCHFVFVCVQYRMDHYELLEVLIVGLAQRCHIPWCHALSKSLERPSAIEQGSKTVYKLSKPCLENRNGVHKGLTSSLRKPLKTISIGQIRNPSDHKSHRTKLLIIGHSLTWLTRNVII